MIEETFARIKQRLDALNLSAARASVMAGLSQDGIRNLKRAATGTRDAKGFNIRTISALAPVLETSVEWLLEGKGSAEAVNSPVTHVPVISWVAAGAGREAEQEGGEWPVLSVASLPPGDWFALEVRGDSMDHAVPDGGRILVNRRDRTLVNKRLYVAAVGRDGSFETTFKRYVAGPVPMLAPWSTNPDHVPILLDEHTKIIGRVGLSLMEW